MARKRLMQAINEALFEEMERDPRVIVFGEDVELAIMGDTRGLIDRFGPDRVRNTPICEQTLTGMAVGLASAGYRPILHMMMNNFIYTGMDAIANQMSKLRLMTGGQMAMPITILAGYGGGSSKAAQHSDTIYPMLMNLGGLNVITPASPADAKGLLKSAIRNDNPTFYLEAATRAAEMGEVPDGEYLVPLGKCSVLTEGKDVTIVAIGPTVRHALNAAKKLEEQGVSAMVVDPRTLVPLDEDGIIDAVRKTGRLVVCDEARDRCSAASQIAAIVADRAFEALKAPIRRVTVPNVAMPYAPGAEAALLPNADRIEAAALGLLKKISA